eukprot:sb/3475375/
MQSSEYSRTPIYREDNGNPPNIRNYSNVSEENITVSHFISGQEPTKTSKQPIRNRYLGHETGYQPIRDQYFVLISVPPNASPMLLLSIYFVAKTTTNMATRNSHKISPSFEHCLSEGRDLVNSRSVN